MRLLKIQMTHQKITEEALPKDFPYGGRGMVDYLLTKHMNPQAHPLSEESLFVVACGILAGTIAPSTSRVSIGAKSPLTGCIREANVGGTAGALMGAMDLIAIMVEGKSDQPKILKIDKNEAVLENGSFVAGLKNYEACREIRKKYGDKISIILTGPAGEYKMLNSTVAVTDTDGLPCRHAARGGLGAVMGAKGLKAIVLDEREVKPRSLSKPDGFKIAVKKCVEAIKNKPISKNLGKLGTAVWINSCNETGQLPTLNHHYGAWDKIECINAEALLKVLSERKGKSGHACSRGCFIRCSNSFIGPNGTHITSGLEYETLALFGANLGIDDLDTIAKLDRTCDELGIDTIEMGNTIGALNEVGVFEFGNKIKAIKLLKEVEKATPLGKIIGSGTEIACKVFGISRVPAIRGMGIPAHMARSRKGTGLTYVTSPQTADHTAGTVSEEPLSPYGQAERSQKAQRDMAAFDCLGMCWFTFIVDRYDIFTEMINNLLGWEWDVERYLKLGEDVIKMELNFNQKAGTFNYQANVPKWLKDELLQPLQTAFDIPEKDYKTFWKNF